MLVQHGTAADYMDPINGTSNGNASRTKTASKTSKNSYHKKMSTSSHNTLMSKSSTGSSDTEPFYLHPPSVRQSQDNLYNQSSTRQSSPPELYGLPNDGLYINPMRNGILTPPSPNGSVSGESFYLHDPQEVIYNRVKDLFDSDSGASNKESSTGSLNGSSSVNSVPAGQPPNAMTVQVEVHSSSSGAGSGSEESLSVSSTSDDAAAIKRAASRTQIASSPGSNSTNPSGNGIEQHDYEDIYLVREEARVATKSKYGTGRSRSRDSGSHSRSASASSTHSTDVIVHFGGGDNNNGGRNSGGANRDNILNKRNKLNDNGKGNKFENPKKSNESNANGNAKMMNNQMKNDTYESVCSPEDVAERTKMAQRHTLNSNGGSSGFGSSSNASNVTSNSGSSAMNNGRVLKRVVSAPVAVNEVKGKRLCDAHNFLFLLLNDFVFVLCCRIQ